MTAPSQTPSDVQRAVDAGLVTWPEVLRVLRDDLHMPEGSIDGWKSGDREVGAVLLGWIERERQSDAQT